VTARDRQKGEDALKGILEPGKVELLMLDLNSLESVRKCAEDLLSKSSTLDIIINNAGIMALPERTPTADGFEAQFGTNHLAHFLLFQLLKPTLLKSATPEFASRVVCVSSSGHRRSAVHLDDLQLEKSYDPWTGYGQSKTANIYMANEIERRYGSRGLHGYSLHPGGIWTGLQIHIDTSAYKGNVDIERSIKSVPQGAATQVWAAVDKEWEGKGGKYLEDCQIAQPSGEVKGPLGGGYATWAYDEDAAKQLWIQSCILVSVADD
jgi:NAD(P)-dependent dehydrogenase (short-subunit alcohol dehydrogenase family)